IAAIGEQLHRREYRHEIHLDEKHLVFTVKRTGLDEDHGRPPLGKTVTERRRGPVISIPANMSRHELRDRLIHCDDKTTIPFESRGQGLRLITEYDQERDRGLLVCPSGGCQSLLIMKIEADLRPP